MVSEDCHAHHAGRAGACPRIDTVLNLWHSTRAVLSDTVPLVVSRQLLTAFAHSIAQLPPEPQKEVAEKCVCAVHARLGGC